MPATEQGDARDRYLVIPRTVTLVRKGDSYLLIKGSNDKRLWPGKYNGVGGHVERGEDVLASATREFREETGLDAKLWLCGTVMVDAGAVGVILHVFTGEVLGGEIRGSAEGEPRWVAYDQLQDLPTVEDLSQLVARIHGMQLGDPPFAALSHYDGSGRLVLQFAER